jgi:4'-phosphopantetheinyl transferase
MSATPSCADPRAICAWHASVHQIWPGPESRARASAWLSPAERVRHGRYRHDIDRDMFLLGRVMARTIVGRALGVAPETWPWREGPRGRPEVDLPQTPCSFNVAHSGGTVVCAVAHGVEVGIDIEDRRRTRLERDLVDRYCSPDEAAAVARGGESGWRDEFLKYWTLKEAYLKARGLGIAVHLADLSFTLAADRVAVAFHGSLAGADPHWAFDLRPLGSDHFVAIAASTPDGRRPIFTLEPLPPSWLP